MGFNIKKYSSSFLIAAMVVGCTTDPTERPTPPTGMMPTPPPPKIPVTPVDIKATAQKNIATAIRALATSEDMGAEMDIFKDLDIRITRDRCDESLPPTEPGMMPPEPMPCEQKSVTERADEMSTDMVDEIFKSEHLEIEEEKRVVYRMRTECEEDKEPTPTDPGSDPGNNPDPGNDPEPEPMEECEPTDIRFVFTSVRDGDLDVDVMIGENQLKAVSIELYENSVGMNVDLTELQALMTDVEDLLGVPEDGPGLPDTMSGAIYAGLSNSGNGVYEASFSITKAIEVASSKAGSEYRIQVGVANPAGSLTINDVAKSITGALNMKVVDIEGMTGIADIEGLNEGKINLHIGGFGGSMTLSEGGETDTIQVNDINMGTESTYVAFDGKRLVTIDLNETAGRKFSLTANNKEEGLELGFAPSFDVKAALSLDSIIDQNSEDTPPEWLLNETFQATIDGAAMPAILIMGLFDDESSEPGEPVSPPGGEDGEDGEGGTPLPPEEPTEDEGPSNIFKVVDGLLTLKAINAGKEVRVAAGQCLIAGNEESEPMMGEPMPEPESEHLFDMLRAGSCEE